MSTAREMAGSRQADAGLPSGHSDFKIGTVAIDPESQEPIVATDVRPAEAANQERVFVVTYQEVTPFNEAEYDPWVSCAAIGLVFSWIPIVGILTFCFNANAPRNSLRHSLATMALLVSFMVLLFNIIFWSTY